jgi:hypothetical protein
MGLGFIGLRRFDEAIVAAKKALRQEPLYSVALHCLASGSLALSVDDPTGVSPAPPRLNRSHQRLSAAM